MTDHANTQLVLVAPTADFLQLRLYSYFEMTDHVNTRVVLDVLTSTACNFDATATLDDGIM